MNSLEQKILQNEKLALQQDRDQFGGEFRLFRLNLHEKGDVECKSFSSYSEEFKDFIYNIIHNLPECRSLEVYFLSCSRGWFEFRISDRPRWKEILNLLSQLKYDSSHIQTMESLLFSEED